nr:hypothetical protein CPGR_01940 [Mycolicibacterium komanii]
MAGRRRKRAYRRDAHGRFAPASGVSSEDERRKKRRRTVAGVTVTVGAVAATQAHPASRTRTAATQRKIVKGHVARASADHAKLSSMRARAFPTTAVTGRSFNAKAARAEGRTLTKGYRKQVKIVRKSARKSR